jgi:hypothetical protein
MAAEASEGHLEGGTVPVQERVDSLERQIEEIKRALELLMEDNDTQPELRRAWFALQMLPPED